MAIIRISGTIGAGKTTLAKQLADVLGYQYLSGSEIFRKMAAERNMRIGDFYKSLENTPEVEKETDARQEKLINEKDNLVVDGRMAPFQKTHFKKTNILLLVEEKEAIHRERKRLEYMNLSEEALGQQIKERSQTEQERYQKLYGITDYLEPGHFDIVLDTSKHTAEEVFETIMSTLDGFGISPTRAEPQ